jgi:molybdopterin synthase catalytic subunit
VADLIAQPLVGIVDEPIDVAALYSSVVGAGVGAISVFLGTVRDSNDGHAVTGIDYDAYRPMAELELARIVAEVQQEIPGVVISTVHRLGTLGIGDVSVAIAAGHARRKQAMLATQQVIELIKERVPVWKLEHYADGRREWVDPSGAPK